MPRIFKLAVSLPIVALAICLFNSNRVMGQTVSRVLTAANKAASESAPVVPADDRPVSKDTAASEGVRLSALEETLRMQSAQLEQMRKMMLEQQETIRQLAAKLSANDVPARAELTVASKVSAESESTRITAEPQTAIEDRLKKVEGRVSELGAIKFSGDLRLRAESIFGQSNSLANGDNPAVLGNELSPRHRMRLRARLQMRGSINDEFDWGLRLASGSFADSISTNQTLTDFFNRKPFALDQAFVTYKPKRAPGLRLQGGKFEPPWVFTEMTIDNDLMVDGFNESYARAFKKSTLKDLTLVAWQLPLLERNSAFVRNSNGTVNIDQSRRGGRDLALYGGQIRARLEPNPKVALTLSAADLFFSGTQFISPVQVFGNQLLLPVTFTIPASGTTPAQTITTQVAISRELLVAGNGNLGLTNASNNATNRDGRLSSGYNLVDMLARLELKQSKRFPVTLLFDFVTNTQTHDVITAAASGANLLLPNHEKHGYWGEIQVGSTKARGDVQFGYTFLRIQKDAVLTPFNFSDVTQQSDMRGHRLQFAYAVDPRVTFTVTGIVTERPNGALGPFAATPPGSLNRPTTRLQFDTVIKF
ncbi:MAG: Phosphate-selective porin [Acidobacteria bacterium]|nr:Phosphate-selective porin [Acidobacteriota bacterium]